jgi:hypothetical protein
MFTLLFGSLYGQGLIIEEDEISMSSQGNSTGNLFFVKYTGQGQDTILYQAVDSLTMYTFEKNRFKMLLADTLTNNALGYSVEFINTSDEVEIINCESLYKIDSSDRRIVEPINRELKYHHLWAGIDLVFYENQNTLMYDYQLC